MPAVLIALLGAIVSGLVFRVLASIGFAMVTAAFINQVIADYLNRSIQQMGTALSPQVSAYLNIARVDDCISIMIGALMFVATYKSMKFIFIRGR